MIEVRRRARRRGKDSTGTKLESKTQKQTHFEHREPLIYESQKQTHLI